MTVINSEPYTIERTVLVGDINSRYDKYAMEEISWVLLDGNTFSQVQACYKQNKRNDNTFLSSRSQSLESIVSLPIKFLTMVIFKNCQRLNMANLQIQVQEFENLDLISKVEFN